MSKRAIRLPNVETTSEFTIEIEVRYHKDWSRRGFHLHVQPVKYEVGDGYTTTMYNPRDGFRRFIAPASRFSARKLDEAVAQAQALVPDMVQAVLDAQGLELATASTERAS